MSIVVKLGGHLIPPDLDIEVISDYAEKIRELSEQNKVVVVVGGGENARKYIDAARSLGADEGLCDVIGIEMTRLNARLLISKLGEDAYPTPPVTVEGLRRAFAESRIVVMGGLQPGQSTNAVAALAAETVGADVLIVATDVDGVYTDDPKLVPTAKKMERITPDKLLRMMIKKGRRAGEYMLFDTVSLEVIKRSSIRTYVIDGRDPNNFDRVLRGERVGTLVGSQ